MDVTCIDKVESDRAPPGVADLRARPRELIHKNARRLRFSMDILEAVERALVVFIAVGTPRARGRLARPVVHLPGRRDDRQHERLQGRRDEVDRPDRTGAEEISGEPGRPRVLRRLEPRVPYGRARRSRTSAPDRVVIGSRDPKSPSSRTAAPHGPGVPLRNRRRPVSRKYASNSFLAWRSRSSARSRGVFSCSSRWIP